MSPRVVHEHRDSEASWAGWAVVTTILALAVIGLLAYFIWYAPSRGVDQTDITVETPAPTQPVPSAPPPQATTPPPAGEGAGPSGDGGTTERAPSGGSTQPDQQSTPSDGGNQSGGQ